MAKWKKFTGSEEHKKMILNADRFMIKNHKGEEWNLPRLQCPPFDEITSFLICEPHPHREMIIEWANTGRPVYRLQINRTWALDDEPRWYPDFKYSFDPPREKIRYRVALMSYTSESRTQTVNNQKEEDEIEEELAFSKWLTDWQEVEI